MTEIGVFLLFLAMLVSTFKLMVLNRDSTGGTGW